MLPKEITDWLAEHNKGDLFECNWAEIREALFSAGRSCPMADYALYGEVAQGKGKIEMELLEAAQYYRKLLPHMLGWPVVFWRGNDKFWCLACGVQSYYAEDMEHSSECNRVELALKG